MFAGVVYVSDIREKLCASCPYLNPLNGQCTVTGCVNPNRFESKMTELEVLEGE